jgi:hypothetical protein
MLRQHFTIPSSPAATAVHSGGGCKAVALEMVFNIDHFKRL